MSATNCPSCGKPGTLVQDAVRSEYECEDPDCDWFREQWEVTGLTPEFDATGHGFRVLTFQDRYGEPCTLQKSSLASENAVWFGTSGRVDVGPPWKPFPLPDNALVHSRMHLTQEQVRQLLPYLQYFADTGQLPSIPFST